ncbi:MAG: hypothetical protein KAW89_07150 [Armatimonadetes bacterium]|nr:hypothetical protein [Armatimonadota bacterium]
MRRDYMMLAVWFTLVAVGVTGTVALCLMLNRIGCGGTVRVGSIRGIEQRTDLQFPPDTVLMQGKYDSVVMSADLMAKLQMPRDALDGFLSGPPFLGNTSRSERVLHDKFNGLGVNDWHPDAAKNFISASALYRENSYSVWILADIDDPQTAVIYLLWELQ